MRYDTMPSSCKMLNTDIILANNIASSCQAPKVTILKVVLLRRREDSGINFNFVYLSAFTLV